jgi:hypothetical protein
MEFGQCHKRYRKGYLVWLCRVFITWGGIMVDVSEGRSGLAVLVVRGTVVFERDIRSHRIDMLRWYPVFW